MFGAAKREIPFKDYCLILQVHPEADGAMIDAAYWHLAKRYNQATAFDPKARARIEELNEAYIVLGSAEKREQYMRVRARVLGEGALPQVPEVALPSPPLAVMARQRPRERYEQRAQEKPHSSLGRRLVLGAVVALGIGGVALMATLSLLAASPVVAGVLAALLAVAGLMAAVARVRGSRASTQPRTRANVVPAARKPSAEDAPPPVAAVNDQPRTAPRKPAPPDPALVDEDQIARLKAETRKLRAAATTNSLSAKPDPLAESASSHTLSERQSALQGASDPAPSLDASQRVDRAQIEQIKAETERLRAAQRQGAQKPTPPTADEIL